MSKVMRTLSVSFVINTDRTEKDEDEITSDVADIVRGALASSGVAEWPCMIVPPDVNT